MVCMLGGELSALMLAQDLAACRQDALKPPPELAQRLAAMALAEHARMGGALINTQGALIRAGLAEAERDRPSDDAPPTWQRVWGYWESAGVGLPASEFALTAVKRAALVDTPWSAAFISHVMRRAGLDEAQFHFSATHQAYVRAAFTSSADEARATPTAYAYRACNAFMTQPRVGDVLCSTRGDDADVDTFPRLGRALIWRSLSMHCELVVEKGDFHIALVGGNVLQTVVLRQMALQTNGTGLLWPAYMAAIHANQTVISRSQPSEGAVQSLWPETYLSQQSWSVLLQLRPDTRAGAPQVQTPLQARP
ncbi:DUF2272 domain-containing protein [Ottowia sp.]|uniref:DUF2272 domain-containing protein n=1 Tax=Ottowia sp. TaxID=1898956 RepID=UPI003A872B77